MDSDNLLDTNSVEDLGNYLRAHRKKANITLEEIQEETKIRIKYLKALETGDLSTIPGGEVYVKGFLQNYAKAINLDPSEILRIYKQIKGEDLIKEKIEVSSDEYEESKNLISSIINKISPKGKGIFSLIVIAVVIIILAFSIKSIRSTPNITSPPSGNNHQNIESENQDTDETLEKDKSQDLYEQDSRNVEDENQDKAQIKLKEDTKQKTVYEVSDKEINIVIEVINDRCWMSVEKDGEFEYEGTLSEGDSKEFNADDDLIIRVGNPLVVKIKANNNDLGILGGQTRDIIFLKRGA